MIISRAQMNAKSIPFPGLRIYAAKLKVRYRVSLKPEKAMIEAGLVQLTTDPAKVKSLAGWDWIRQSVEPLSVTNMAFN